MAERIRVSAGEVEHAKLDHARKKGTGSFFADILGAPALKRPALSEAVGKYRNALTQGDVRAGEAVSKATGLHRVFEEEIRTPVKRQGPFEVTHVQNVKRLSAPLVKAQKFLTPIFAYEGLRRIIGGGHSEEKAAGETKMTMTRDEQTVMLKAASMIEKLGKENELLVDEVARLTHQNAAVKVAGDMAKKGLISQDDLEKKAGELAGEDLEVVKKAIDLTQSGFELGKVEKTAKVEGSEEDELDPITAMLVDDIHGKNTR